MVQALVVTTLGSGVIILDLVLLVVVQEAHLVVQEASLVAQEVHLAVQEAHLAVQEAHLVVQEGHLAVQVLKFFLPENTRKDHQRNYNWNLN